MCWRGNLQSSAPVICSAALALSSAVKISVTLSVCTVSHQPTRFFRHQDSHAFWPRDLLWFALNRVRASSRPARSGKDIHPSWASCSSVLTSARLVLTRSFPPLSRTLFTNSSSCSAVDVDYAFSSAQCQADSLFKVRRHLNFLYVDLSPTRRMWYRLAESTPRSELTPEAVSDPSFGCSPAATAKANALLAIGASFDHVEEAMRMCCF